MPILAGQEWECNNAITTPSKIPCSLGDTVEQYDFKFLRDEVLLLQVHHRVRVEEKNEQACVLDVIVLWINRLRGDL